MWLSKDAVHQTVLEAVADVAAGRARAVGLRRRRPRSKATPKPTKKP